MSDSDSEDEDPNKGPGEGNEDPGKGNEGPGKGKISVRKKKAESVEEKLRRIAADRRFRENQAKQDQMFSDEEDDRQRGEKRKGSRKFKTSTSIKKTRPLDLDELLNLAENLNGDGDDDDDPQFMEAIGIIDQRNILIQELRNTIRELEQAQKQGQDNQAQIEILRGTQIDQERRYQEEYIRLQSIQSEMQNTIRDLEENQHKTIDENQQLLELSQRLAIINETLSREKETLQEQIEILTARVESLKNDNIELIKQVEQVNTDFQKLQSDNAEERKLATEKSQEDLAGLTASINDNLDKIKNLTSDLITLQTNKEFQEEVSRQEMQKLTEEKDKQQRLNTQQISDLTRELKDTKEKYNLLVNKGAEYIEKISEFQARINQLQKSTEDCERQLDDCRRQLKDCEEEKTDLTEKLKKCEDSKLSSRPGSSLAKGPRPDRGQGPGPNKGPAETILQNLAEKQGREIEPFIFYDVYYNPDRNEFYTKETGVVDIEYATSFANHKEKEFLIKQQEAYEKAAAKSKQQKDATRRPPAAVEEVAMVQDKASEEYQQKLREFFQLLNRKNQRLSSIQGQASSFLQRINRPEAQLPPIFINAIENFFKKIPIYHQQINQDSSPEQIATIVNFRLPSWNPRLVETLFSEILEKTKKSDSEDFVQTINDFVQTINDLPLKFPIIGSPDHELTGLYFELFPRKDPLADLYSFLDAKDLDYLEETSAFISDFRSKINNYYTVSSRIIDTSEQFIRQMTFIGLYGENDQSVSYNAMLKNVSKLNTIEYLDEIGSKEDQITAIYYIICKVVSQEKLEERVRVGINQAILEFKNADFAPIVLSLPVPVCEKIRDSIEGLCKNPETCRQTCGEKIVEVLDLLDIQISGGQVLGLGRRERLINSANKFIIKQMNTYLKDEDKFDEDQDLELITGNNNTIIIKKLRKLESNEISDIKKNLDSSMPNYPSPNENIEIKNFIELLNELSSDTTSVVSPFISHSQGSEIGFSQDPFITPSVSRKLFDSNSSPIKKEEYDSDTDLGTYSFDSASSSDSETEKKTPFGTKSNKLPAGGSKIIQKGGIAFPFSSAYFTLPDQRPANCNTEDCSRYYDADGNKKENIDRIFQYDLITIVLQILLYADSMHDFKGELNKIRKDVLVNNIFDAFNRLYNIINKPGVNDYNTIRKCIECLKPEIANMLNNFKSKASEEWGGYESVIAYRYTQDIGLSELTILKYIYINPNDLDDPGNFFDKDTLIQLGKEGFIFCSSTSTPGDTKVEIGDDWYNFFVLMNVDGSPVMPTPVDVNTIKQTMRAYEDNPISKDILAYLFGIAGTPDIPATSPEVSNSLLPYKMISKASEDQMSRLLKDHVSNESISNESIPGNSDPSNQAQSIVYESLNNTRTTYENTEVDDERLQPGQQHPNILLISSMQTFLDVYAPANNGGIRITNLTKIESPTDPSKYIGVQIETNQLNVTHPYKLLLTSTSIESIQGIVAKLFNDKTIQYGLTLSMNDPAIAALNATLNPLQKEIMNLAIMYYNNMDPKFKVGSNDDRKNIFMSCVLMWKAFGDYWEVTYVYGLDYMNLRDLINKYLITSTDKNVAFMEFWLGLFGIIAKTSIHLPEAYEAVSVTKDTSDQVSLDVDEENFIKKQMGEGMILNVLPKSKDEFLNIKKLKADLMSIADRWDIIQKSEVVPMEEEVEEEELDVSFKRKSDVEDESPSSDIDPSLSAQPAPMMMIQENIDNIRKIKEKYKPIEQESSIAAFSYLMQGIPDDDNKKKLRDYIDTEIKKNNDNIINLNKKIAEMNPSLGIAQQFDKNCLNVLDSDDLKKSELKNSIKEILERRGEANNQIIKECEAKISSNMIQILKS
jgi:hypothetical protein